MPPRTSVCLVAALVAASPLAAQVAVTDPVQNALMTLNNQVLTQHSLFMKLQMVQDAEIIKNNFVQAEGYYNYIDQRSKGRGGLVGYYKEMVESDVNQVVDAEKMNLRNDATSVTGPTLVNDFALKAADEATRASGDAIDGAGRTLDGGVNAADSAYGDSKFGAFNSALRRRNGTRAAAFSSALTVAGAAGRQIDASDLQVGELTKAVNDLRKQAADPNIDDKTYESLTLSLNAVQAQLAVELHRMLSINAQLTKAMLDSQNVEQAFSRQTAADFHGYARDAAQKRGSLGTDANAVKRELNRMPSR